MTTEVEAEQLAARKSHEAERLATRKLVVEIEAAELAIEKGRLELLEKIEAYEDRTARLYRFTVDVDNESVGGAIDWLDRMVETPNVPATLSLSSFGGSCFDGLALFDAMEAARALGLDLTTMCSGYTASMASILMQAGTTRLATSHAWFHIHEPATVTWGKTSEHRDETRLLEGLWDQAIDIFANRSKLTARQIRDRFERKEEWLTASEALKLGFVDGIA